MIEKINISIRKFIAHRKHGSVNDEQKSKLDMVSQLEKLSDTCEYYEIPVQKGVVYSFKKNPHILIGGTTGYGKSYFTNYLIVMASIKGANLFICDPKSSDLAGLDRVMPKEKVGVSKQEILDLTKQVYKTMEERYKTMQELKEEQNLFDGDFTTFNMPVALLVIDELGALTSSLDKKEKEEFDKHLKQLILKGRQAGCFVCLITQQANAKNVPTEIRDQCGFRTFLGQPKLQDKAMVFGDGYEYIDRVYDKGEGLFLLDGVTDNPTLIQTPYYDGKELQNVYKYAFRNQEMYIHGDERLVERITPKTM
ncbi:FtsK/SpoIIIE domain-containing protein [Staphylococcus capitis]|uniref:FtsK/SpoIIIE domain-containing protein n=1 Tax=Staphylococcus capitis TaxID=29388 RepID=UPI003CF22CE5